MRRSLSRPAGFTIVELLVVIVVIGVLAAISLVAYSGISSKAIASTLQSDLTNSSKQLKLFRVEAGAYPATIDCGQADSSTNKCLKASPGSTYTDYQVDDMSNPQSFTLTEMNSGQYWSISDDGVPVYIASGTYWKQVFAGGSDSCAIASDNQAYCWGYNNYGQLGNNSTTNSSVPVAVNTGGVLSGKTIKSVASGSNAHTCAIASDSQAYCWGFNIQGQLGNNSTTNSSVPVAVNAGGVLSGKTIKSVTAGGSSFTCAIASDNQAYCWGYSNYGQLGNNSTTSSSVPVAVDTSGVLNSKTIKSITAGSAHTCAIASDNQAYCWGNNTQGQLGNNSTTNSSVPVAVDTGGVLNGKTIKSITAGSFHTCAIASDSQAYCWGANSNGSLGNNSTTRSLVPVAVDTSGVLSGKTIKSIVASNLSHTCAIASDSQAYCWGYNDSSGPLGNNSTTRSLVPVAVYNSGVLSGKTIKSIAAGDHTCAIASDSQAYCWGGGSNGQLGNNSWIYSLVPVQVIPLGS